MENMTSYRTYWGIWLVLLVLTLLMIVLEGAELGAVATVLVLVTAMLAKATLIVGWFMHLRYERLALAVSVVAGTMLTAAFLYFLLIPDGIAALQLSPAVLEGGSTGSP